jgi:hypothetical protein
VRDRYPALAGAVPGSPADGGITRARKLLHLLGETMLVLTGPGSGAGELLAGAAAARARFLVRLTGARRPPVLRRLPGGPVLSLTGGVRARIIAASVTVTCHDAAACGSTCRLAAALPARRAWPAGALIALYHERREHEAACLALRHAPPQGRVLRSRDPAGPEQEMRALLARCQAPRIAGAGAAVPAPAPAAPAARPPPGPPPARSPAPAASSAARRTWPAAPAGPSWRACTARAGPGPARPDHR